MIAIETLVNTLNDALNGIIGGYDGETRRFSIIPDGGEYEGYKREYNDITTYIDGVATVTDSAPTHRNTNASTRLRVFLSQRFCRPFTFFTRFSSTEPCGFTVPTYNRSPRPL